MAKSNIARRLGAFYGIEDGDETTNTEVGEQPIADEVSAPVADVAEAAAEVAEEEEALADLTTDADQTEDLQGAVEVATNGGEEAMSAESAAWVRLALHQITGKYGITSDVMPSLESFGGSSGRRAATRATLEGISDFLKKIWNAIKAQIQKVWAYMKNWYLKVLDAAPRLKKKAEAVSKRSENMTGSPESKDVSGPLKQLHIDGKAPDGSLLAAKFKKISETLELGLGSKTASGYESTFEKFEKAINDIAEKDAKDVAKTDGLTGHQRAATAESFTSFVMSLEAGGSGVLLDADGKPTGLQTAPVVNEIMTPVVQQQASTVTSATNTKPPSSGKKNDRFGVGTTCNEPEELPGGKASFILDAAEPTSAVERSRHLGNKFTDFKEKPKEVDASGDFKTLNSSHIQSICDSIVEICDHIIDYKKAWEKRDKYTAKMKSSVDKAVSNADKEKADDQNSEAAIKIKRSAVRDIAKGLHNTWSKGSSYESAIINYGISVSRAALSVCEASIAEYKD
jgi:hypothetical protein